MELHPNSATDAKWTGLKNEQTNAFINDASSVTVVVLAADRVTVVISAVTLGYVAASDGIYRGVVAASASIVAGVQYFVKVIAVTSSGTDQRSEMITATDRPFKG